MSKEWNKVTFDLFLTKKFQILEIIDVKIGRVEVENEIFIIFSVKNLAEENIELSFSWAKMPKEKKKNYKIRKNKKRRFVVPDKRRIVLLWRKSE